ncbi:MAG: hypothetical protein K2G11_06525 [Muribaculaceae bacterium]|nr:hypothetical protein [Muribaculaceae bacterium]
MKCKIILEIESDLTDKDALIDSLWDGLDQVDANEINLIGIEEVEDNGD